MIIFFRVVIIFLLFIRFRISSNKVRMLFIYNIFIELKFVRFFLIKFIRVLLVFLFLNYNSYIYYRVGLTIHYGYVFIYAFRIVFL